MCSESVFDLRAGDCMNNLEEIEAFYFHPTEQSWQTQDDRTVLCIALFPRPRRGAL